MTGFSHCFVQRLHVGTQTGRMTPGAVGSEASSHTSRPNAVALMRVCVGGETCLSSLLETDVERERLDGAAANARVDCLFRWVARSMAFAPARSGEHLESTSDAKAAKTRNVEGAEKS